MYVKKIIGLCNTHFSYLGDHVSLTKVLLASQKNLGWIPWHFHCPSGYTGYSVTIGYQFYAKILMLPPRTKFFRCQLTMPCRKEVGYWNGMPHFTRFLLFKCKQVASDKEIERPNAKLRQTESDISLGEIYIKDSDWEKHLGNIHPVHGIVFLKLVQWSSWWANVRSGTCVREKRVVETRVASRFSKTPTYSSESFCSYSQGLIK